MATRQMSNDDIRQKYPANSHAAKDRASYSNYSEPVMDISVNTQSTERVEQKDIRKVTTAKVRKQSLLKRIGRSIIEDGIDAAKEKAYNEVIVPGLKTIIYDTIQDILDTMLFGGEGARDYRRRSGGRRQGDRASYTGYYEKKAGRSESYRADPRYEPDDIFVDTRAEAHAVLDELDYIIHKYGQASVADFYDIVGVTSDWTDNRYGWTSLRDASIKPVREGFEIILPRTRVLDD